MYDYDLIPKVNTTKDWWLIVSFHFQKCQKEVIPLTYWANVIERFTVQLMFWKINPNIFIKAHVQTSIPTIDSGVEFLMNCSSVTL